MVKEKKNQVVNPFENIEAATREGSAENLAVMDGNHIELPMEDEVESSPETDSMREKVRDLIQVVSSSYWELAELMARILDQKVYKLWGYRTFDQYVDEECGFNKSKAYDLARIFKYFTHTLKEKMQYDPAKYDQVVASVKQMGWNKALKLATEKVITSENATEVVAEAKNMSLKALDERCKEIIDEMPKEQQEELKETNTDKVVRKSFLFTLYQLDVLEKAIAKAKSQLRPGANDTSALAFICGDFDSSFDASRGNGEPQEYLSKIERLLECNIVATNQDASQIIYGFENLSKMSSPEVSGRLE